MSSIVYGLHIKYLGGIWVPAVVARVTVLGNVWGVAGATEEMSSVATEEMSSVATRNPDIQASRLLAAGLG